MSEIWLPGNGVVPLHIRQAEQAIKEYDARLSLGRNDQTGDWVVLMDRQDGPPFPVLGLGIELPSADDIKAKMYRHDASRRGAEIVAEVQKRNDARMQKFKDAADDASGVAAEAYEWAFRKMGAHPNPRIFVPGG